MSCSHFDDITCAKTHNSNSLLFLIFPLTRFFQSVPPAPVYSLKTGTLTWRSVNPSTAQRRGVCFQHPGNVLPVELYASKCWKCSKCSSQAQRCNPSHKEEDRREQELQGGHAGTDCEFCFDLSSWILDLCSSYMCWLPLGPGDLCEELWQQISHPGDNTGFHWGGSGAVHHPE